MASKKDRWLLPEGVEDLLPRQAERLERQRRALLELFHTWGYELVMPPLIEYIDSLLVGTGKDLDLQTFKLIDQLTGRLMGIRADMTPQVARIDAHLLRRETPTRLCYAGAVLHARPAGHGRSRTPFQIGAEIYGHAGIESDVEILCLMVESLRRCGVEQLHIDLGHVGIYRALVGEAGLDNEQEEILFDVLQRKARPELEANLAQWRICERHQRHFEALIELNGDVSVLTEARERFSDAGEAVRAALENLCLIAEHAGRRLEGVHLYFDLAELRGYRYQSGVVFAAFVPGHGQELARGGRYDDIGRAFGRARPATGFSADLKMLARLGSRNGEARRMIEAPALEDEALEEAIATLRREGERVVRALPGSEGPLPDCDRVLALREGRWQVVPREA